MSKRTQRAAFVILLIIFLLTIIAESVDAQDATPDGSASQLSLGYEPTLGLKLMVPDAQLHYFSGMAYGGGQTYLSVGDPCPSGYTNVVSALGTVWVDANSIPVDIVFESTQPGANVGIFLYDLMNSQWNCNLSFAPSATFHWDTVPRGVYFVWIVSDQPGAVSGNLTINGSTATTSEPAFPTTEPPVAPTSAPKLGR
jgi:hypothetical protein